MKIKGLVLAAALMTVSVGAFAQANAPVVMHRQHEGREQIEHRLERLKDRIRAKVTAGQLPVVEAEALRAEDERVRADMLAMEAAHEGHLTAEDRAVLNHRVDEISRRIGR